MLRTDHRPTRRVVGVFNHWTFSPALVIFYLSIHGYLDYFHLYWLVLVVLSEHSYTVTSSPLYHKEGERQLLWVLKTLLNHHINDRSRLQDKDSVDLFLLSGLSRGRSGLYKHKNHKHLLTGYSYIIHQSGVKDWDLFFCVPSLSTDIVHKPFSATIRFIYSFCC